MCAGLSACQPAPEISDSAIRRNQADHRVQVLFDKAQPLLQQPVFDKPVAYLDELIILQKLVKQADTVYREARISHVTHPEFEQVAQQLKQSNVPLAKASLDAFEQAIDIALAFKQKKAAVESLPIYDNTLAKRALLEELKVLNQELEDCCTDQIHSINQLLQHNAHEFNEVIRLGHSTLDYMGMLIREDIDVKTLQQKISEQRQYLALLNNEKAEQTP